MIVNTRRLFARLLAQLRVDVVCDVGSMDGLDALVFGRAVPQATIYAFEPNPENFRLMETDARLKARDIHLVAAAAADRAGEAEFFLVDADYRRDDPRRGMSSLYRRADGWSTSNGVVSVPTTRLDAFLGSRCVPDSCVALWIDVEGAAYQVVEGAAGIAKQAQLVHVEVETAPCISATQRLYPEVKTLLQQFGFRELATDRAPSDLQFNALFARRDLSPWRRWRVSVLLYRARLRYLLDAAVGRLCPACLRRYQAVRTSRRARREAAAP